MAAFTDRVRSAWNAFSNREQDHLMPESTYSGFMGGTFGVRPDRSSLRIAKDRSIVPSVYTRISVDVAIIDFRHVRLDDNGRFSEEINSGLNDCLSVEANLDQAAMSFMQDIVLMCFDKGVACVVPVDTSDDPTFTAAYDIRTLRVGEIKQYFPRHVQILLYNDRTGKKQLITLPKSTVAIIENPFYQVMNEPNSTLQRLMKKLSLLDLVDNASSSGKLDLIIQLPYVIKSEQRRQQAEQRAKDIEFQLRTNQYGIAYTDGTEKVTQLNRPAENKLLEQIESLTKLLFSQLGLTPEIMDGTADEAAMVNYTNRTVKPMADIIVQELRRKFLTKTARSQKQSVVYFYNPFQLIPISKLGDLVDKLSRNEVLTANEFRGFMGLKPSDEPKADKLINSNMPVAATGVTVVPPDTTATAPETVAASSAPPVTVSDMADQFLNSGGIITHNVTPSLSKRPSAVTTSS